MSDSPKAVFLSYARDDAAAARRIAEALRASGLEVWFDENELRGGDSWDAKIRRQIRECALFLPVISACTQSRGEGYFRLEWKLAVERTHLMAEGIPFIAPIVIDDTNENGAVVPAEFMRVQWTRLAGALPTPNFIAQVKRLLDGKEPVGAALRRDPAEPSRHKAAPTTRPSWLVPAAVVLVAIAIFGVWSMQKSESTPATASAITKGAMEKREPSVAVLAFANLSDDKGNEYFSDGISEELLNVLAKISGLKVSARTSAFYFKGKEVPIPEIAKQLGVAYVVEGSVRKQGDKVRITAQLIKAADGFHVWSDTFTRDLKDIFAVQDEIAGLIANNLQLKMGMVAARPTIDIEAYQEFLAGRAAAAKASNADLLEAVAHFTKAVAIEPKFTAAWVQLASMHTQLGRWGGAPTLQSWKAARAAIDKARALEPDSPDMLVALGWISRTGEWDWHGAEAAFRRALQLRPDHPETLAGAAVLLYNIGQDAEAFRLGQQAAQLDPLNPATQLDLSIMFYLSSKWAEAERTARRALALAPGGAGYHGILAWGLMGQRRYDEAVVEAKLDSDEVQQATVLGLVAVARGQEEAARAQIARMEEIARTDPDRADLQLTIAWISAALGEKDRAFAALDKAQASRDPSIAWLRNGSQLAPLFTDPRWDVLLRKVGLAADQLR